MRVESLFHGNIASGPGTTLDRDCSIGGKTKGLRLSGWEVHVSTGSGRDCLLSPFDAGGGGGGGGGESSLGRWDGD